MAQKVWGAGSGAGTNHDLGTAINWTGDALPGAADDVIFNSTCVEPVTDGLADLSAVALTSWTVAEGYTGYLGGAEGTAVTVNSTAFTFAGQGTTASSVNCNTVTNARIVSTVAQCYIQGTITTLDVLKGSVTLHGSGTTTTLNVSKTDADTDVVLTIKDSATVTTLNHAAGTTTHTSSATITTANMYGGTFTLSDGTATTLRQQGGTFYCSSDNGTVITTAIISGGDFSCENQSLPITITDLTMYPDSRVVLANGGYNVTVTNGVVWYGGDLVVDRGRVLDIT